MPFAKDEREQWREMMQRGEIPERMHKFMSIYKQMRADECWRSSRFYEMMFEAALVWYEENVDQDL